MVDANIFIALIIVALVEMVKMALPRVTGWITILIALVVGILVAVFSVPLGVVHITIAQGVVDALSAIGISALSLKAGGSSSTNTSYGAKG